MAEDRDRILYTYYNHGEYSIYQAKSADFKPVEVDPQKVDMVPASLPPFNPRQRDLVNTGLRGDGPYRKRIFDQYHHQNRPV